jgi:hypothetical protein
MTPEIRIEQDEDSIAGSYLETNLFRTLSVDWRPKSRRPAMKLGCYPDSHSLIGKSYKLRQDVRATLGLLNALKHE